MIKVVVLIADGTEEIEFVTAYDVLVRAGYKVSSIGVSLPNDTPYATCSRGVRITPDYKNLDDVQLDNIDLVVVPGGAPGAKAIASSPEALGLVKKVHSSQKWVGFICAATTVLTKSGISKCPATSHPSVKKDVVAHGWEYKDDRVVVSGKVVTSRGPGTAILFALTLIEAISGKAARDEVAGPMITAEKL